MSLREVIFGPSERLNKLEKEVSRLQAERKTLYDLVDRLEACIDATNSRTDGETSHIEEVEDRLVDLEAFRDRVEPILEDIKVNGKTEG